MVSTTTSISWIGIFLKLQHSNTLWKFVMYYSIIYIPPLHIAVFSLNQKVRSKKMKFFMTKLESHQGPTCPDLIPALILE